MNNDNGEPASMDKKGSEDVVAPAGGDGEFVDHEMSISDGGAADNPYIEAEIIIKGTKCNRCCWDVDLKKEAVQCFKCQNFFHGVCYKDSRDISSPSALSGTLIPAVANSGSYERRFGRFLFLCDFCMGSFKSATNVLPTTKLLPSVELDKKVDSLSNDVLNFKAEFTLAISSLKEMMTDFTKDPNQIVASESVAANNNASTTSEVLYADVAGLPTQQTQQLLHIASSDISSLSHEEVKEKVVHVKQQVSQSLKDIPTNFVKSNHQKGVLTVAFPDIESREKGSQLIENLNLSASGFHTKNGKKMLPKLTVSGIDSSLLDSIDSNLSHEETRTQQKSIIKNSIISKNDRIKQLTDAGHTLDVVFMKWSGNSSDRATVAIKVSPAIRAMIFQNQYGKIFIGNNSLSVEDRFFFKQCFHCQQLGHVSTDCPKLDEDPVCFYCMGPHQSKNCPKKRSRTEHCCAKCFHSKVTGEKSDFKSHNAADPECPVILREIQKIAGNTDILSKNVM